MNDKPHSADYFGDTRDFWWNRDFLELMSVRWKLPAVQKALDVGCGIGHWGRCLAPLLPADCMLTGIDREPRWVQEARQRSDEFGQIVPSFCQGEAERLPFADDSFDLVTCQTLLIHVKDPVWIWNREDTLRYFRAGGGIPEAFEACWRKALARDEEFLSGIERGQARVTFAPVCLLVSGRKKLRGSL